MFCDDMSSPIMSQYKIVNDDILKLWLQKIDCHVS